MSPWIGSGDYRRTLGQLGDDPLQQTAAAGMILAVQASPRRGPAAEWIGGMPTDDESRTSSKPLEYEPALPRARRVVRIPRGLYKVHRALLDNVEMLSIVYGILVMMIGWAFKVVGIAFVVEPKRPAA
jgi:hypothetical protein